MKKLALCCLLAACSDPDVVPGSGQGTSVSNGVVSIDATKVPTLAACNSGEVVARNNGSTTGWECLPQLSLQVGKAAQATSADNATHAAATDNATKLGGHSADYFLAAGAQAPDSASVGGQSLAQLDGRYVRAQSGEPVAQGGGISIAGDGAIGGKLDVAGDVNAAGKFIGDGSAVTGVVAASVAGPNVTGTLPDGVLSSNVPLLTAGTNTFAGTLAGKFTGDGSGLTGLNASQLTTGTIADARLSTNVPLLNAATNTFTGAVAAGKLTGDGSGLTSLNASQVTTGTVPDGRLSANVPLLDAATNAFVGDMTAKSFSLASGKVTVTDSGVALGTAAKFTGDGSGLVNVNASQLASGTVADARLSSNVALLGGNATFLGDLRGRTFTTPQGNVALSDASGVVASKLSGDGSGLVNLNAANLTNTLSDNRLSSNVALLSNSNLFTGINQFNSNVIVNGVERTPNRPWFVASDSRGWVSSNGWTHVSYDTVKSGNSGGWYNSGSGVFTAPVAGLYLCTASHYVYAGASGTPYIHHVLGCNGQWDGGCGIGNNAAYTIFAENGTTYCCSTDVTRMVHLSVGDYIQSNVYVASGSYNYMYGAYSHFSCALIGAD